MDYFNYLQGFQPDLTFSGDQMPLATGLLHSETQQMLGNLHSDTAIQLAGMNQANQTNLFTHQTNLQANSQNFMQTMQNSNQEFISGLSSFARGTSMISSGLNFAGNVAGSLISGGINLGLMHEQAALQRQNFDYMTGKASDAYQSAGLPSWLAFSGSQGLSNALPRQSTTVSGFNTFQSSIPGNTSAVPWTGSPSQVALGVGNIPSAF